MIQLIVAVTVSLFLVSCISIPRTFIDLSTELNVGEFSVSNYDEGSIRVLTSRILPDRTVTNVSIEVNEGKLKIGEGLIEGNIRTFRASGLLEWLYSRSCYKLTILPENFQLVLDDATVNYESDASIFNGSVDGGSFTLNDSVTFGCGEGEGYIQATANKGLLKLYLKEFSLNNDGASSDTLEFRLKDELLFKVASANQSVVMINGDFVQESIASTHDAILCYEDLCFDAVDADFIGGLIVIMDETISVSHTSIVADVMSMNLNKKEGQSLKVVGEQALITNNRLEFDRNWRRSDAQYNHLSLENVNGMYKSDFGLTDFHSAKIVSSEFDLGYPVLHLKAKQGQNYTLSHAFEAGFLTNLDGMINTKKSSDDRLCASVSNVKIGAMHFSGRENPCEVELRSGHKNAMVYVQLDEVANEGESQDVRSQLQFNGELVLAEHSSLRVSGYIEKSSGDPTVHIPAGRLNIETKSFMHEWQAAGSRVRVGGDVNITNDNGPIVARGRASEGILVSKFKDTPMLKNESIPVKNGVIEIESAWTPAEQQDGEFLMMLFMKEWELANLEATFLLLNTTFKSDVNYVNLELLKEGFAVNEISIGTTLLNFEGGKVRGELSDIKITASAYKGHATANIYAAPVRPILIESIYIGGDISGNHLETEYGYLRNLSAELRDVQFDDKSGFVAQAKNATISVESLEVKHEYQEKTGHAKIYLQNMDLKVENDQSASTVVSEARFDLSAYESDKSERQISGQVKLEIQSFLSIKNDSAKYHGECSEIPITTRVSAGQSRISGDYVNSELIANGLLTVPMVEFTAHDWRCDYSQHWGSFDIYYPAICLRKVWGIEYPILCFKSHTVNVDVKFLAKNERASTVGGSPFAKLTINGEKSKVCFVKPIVAPTWIKFSVTPQFTGLAGEILNKITDEVLKYAEQLVFSIIGNLGLSLFNLLPTHCEEFK